MKKRPWSLEFGSPVREIQQLSYCLVVSYSSLLVVEWNSFESECNNLCNIQQDDDVFAFYHYSVHLSIALIYVQKNTTEEACRNNE